MSAPNEKFASEMRDALKAMMEADPYYADVPIITERLQDIDAKVATIVGKAGGICMVLVTPSFEGVLTNVPGANFDAVRFVGRTFENVKTNATGKEAQHVALYTAALWSQLKPEEFSVALKLDEPAVSLGNDPRFLSYDVNALAAGGTKIEIPRLEDLVVTVADNVQDGDKSVELTHPTPGAVIYYTTNGSAPFPRNPAAQIYLDVFNALSGRTLRARAWLPGFIPSAEKKQTL